MVEVHPSRVVLELTCPWEELIVDAHLRKKLKYTQLQIDLEVQGWDVRRFSFVVGSRGYVAHSLYEVLKAFGVSGMERKSAVKRMSATSLLCSYVIYLSRDSRMWESRPLLGKFLLENAACALQDEHNDAREQ